MHHLPRTELESQVEMLAPNLYRKSGNKLHEAHELTVYAYVQREL